MKEVIAVLIPLLPALLVGFTAFYFFNKQFNHEEKKLKLKQFNNVKSEGLQVRLQAIERLILFLERINPNQLLVRISPVNDDIEAYIQSLLLIIDEEYKHNVTQQLYITDDSWRMVCNAKNAVIQLIKNFEKKQPSKDAGELRENLIKGNFNKVSPTENAIVFLKIEAKDLLGG